VTVAGTITLDCANVASGVPLLLHGVIQGGGTGTLNCTVLQNPSSGTSTINWTSPLNPLYSAASTYTYTTSISPGAQGTTVLTLTGTVTGGLYTGSTVVIATVYANAALLACNSPGGLTSRSGPVSATVVGL
jgi:hypothetical protein